MIDPEWLDKERLMFERDQARRVARRMYRNWLKALALLVKIRAQRDEARDDFAEMKRNYTKAEHHKYMHDLEQEQKNVGAALYALGYGVVGEVDTKRYRNILEAETRKLLEQARKERDALAELAIAQRTNLERQDKLLNEMNDVIYALRSELNVWIGDPVPPYGTFSDDLTPNS